MQSRVRALSYARISGTKGGAPPGSAAVIELLLCWLVSRTYKLYCSGSKVALGLSLRARLLAPPLATAARKYLRYANYDAQVRKYLTSGGKVNANRL